MDSHERNLVIRADAGGRMGTGHVMRCIALGQEWKDSGGRVIIVTACESEGLLRRLQQEGFDVHRLSSMHPDPRDWDATREVLSRFKDSWVVLDGYHFDEAYQQRVKGSGNRLLVIHSMTHPCHCHADVLLNPGLNAERTEHSCEPHTRLLLGTGYLLLRREFLVWREWRRTIPGDARRLLVTLGGSTSRDVIGRVIRAVQKAGITGLETTVVVGPAGSDSAAMQSLCEQGSMPVRLLHNPPDMPGLMAEADLAITGGGTTAWELCFMGLPMLIMVLARNQENTAATMQKAGIAESLGWHEDVSDETIARHVRALVQSRSARDEMSRAQRKLVDGLGAGRVVAELNRIQLN